MYHPTLLRTPSAGNWLDQEIRLLLRPEDYEIRQYGDLVHVIARATGETVWPVLGRRSWLDRILRFSR